MLLLRTTDGHHPGRRFCTLQTQLKETLQDIQELLMANVAKGMGEGEGKELGWP